jgi:hypothetical protein
MPKATKPLEQRLWDAVGALRGNQAPGEYKRIVLGLALRGDEATLNGHLGSLAKEMRAKIKRLLAKHKYPSEMETKAVELALRQVGLMAGEGAGR